MLETATAIKSAGTPTITAPRRTFCPVDRELEERVAVS